MDIPMKCPGCGKRAFDTSCFHDAEHPVEITLKCPQCGQFVRVPIDATMSLPMRKGGYKNPTVTR
jgi:uncharacterized Zn finger protein